jgi:hypothetical protein
MLSLILETFHTEEIKKRLQIARTKIGAKNTFKNQENKNISTQRERDR